MLALLWFLIIPLTLAMSVYAGYAIYRRYKDNRLESMSQILDKHDEAIGDEWISPTPEVECPVVSEGAAMAQWKLLLEEEQSKYPKIETIDFWDRGCMTLSETDEVKAHNDARARLTEWLQGKHVKTSSGYQNVDVLRSIGEKCTAIEKKWEDERKKEELRQNPPKPGAAKKYKQPTYQERVGSPHAKSMPLNGEMSAQTAADSARDLSLFGNREIDDKGGQLLHSDGTLYTPTFLTVAYGVLQQLENHKTYEEQFRMDQLVSAFKEVLKQMEDDAFYLKTLKEEKEKLDKLPVIEHAKLLINRMTEKDIAEMADYAMKVVTKQTPETPAPAKFTSAVKTKTKKATKRKK